MRAFLRWAAASAMLLVGSLPAAGASPGSAPPRAERAVRGFADLAALFVDPPAEYRPVPFWVWNERVTREVIDRDLPELKARGFGGVFIHPRYGLVTEYLSEEWFDLVRYAVTRAKALGLTVWLYDENSFPSGFAGGHVPAEMPESTADGQGLRLVRASVLPGDVSRDCALVLERHGESFLEVPETERVAGRTGDFYLFAKTFYEKGQWYGGFSYIDLLREGVTEKFIELTMRGYERALGDDLGHAVPGIFTDEPHIEPPTRDSLRWTPALFERFAKRHGYDLRTRLPALFEEIGDWRRVRHDYFATLDALFVERWALPWQRYCEAHGLEWTGHYWEHDWPDPRHVPDSTRMAAYQQTPGIDLLFNRYNEEGGGQFGVVRSPRALASVANQLGRRRTLSETYGASGWELTFADMKRLGDWEYALGVNLMNPHLVFQSLLGDRKHDFPQSFSYHAPYWSQLNAVTDYFGRLSLAVSAGRTVNRVLVLEPTTTGWLYATPGEKAHARLGELEADFRTLLLGLEREQVEYDLGSEGILAEHGHVARQQLVVGERAYGLVVTPPRMENAESGTAALLREYLRQGGRVLAFGDAPSRIDGIASETLTRLAARYPRQWIRAASSDAAVARRFLAPRGLRFAEMSRGGAQLFHLRRRLADGELLLLVNSSATERAAGSLVLPAVALSSLDAASGRTEAQPATSTARGLSTRYDLPPAGSLLLFAHARPPARARRVPRAEQTFDRLLPAVGELTVRRLTPNVLPLDYCDLTLAGKEERGLYFYAASERIFKAHGFDDNPWVSSSQYRTRILERDHFAAASGFAAAFHFAVDPGLTTAGLQAVVERPSLWRVSVNEQDVKPLAGAWWLDRDFGVFDVGAFVRVGDNTLTLSLAPMSIFAELAPPVILGDFDLAAAEHGYRLVPPRPLGLGAWKTQGLPFYADRIGYARRLRVKAGARYLVRLGRWNGSLAAVTVDGRAAGVLAWPPYELELPRPAVDGEQTVEVVVYGTLKNLLGPHHNVKDAERGIVTPWSFKYAPAVQPPGEQYDTLGYGLWDAFEVVERQTAARERRP